MRNSLLIGKGGRVLRVLSWEDAITLAYFRDGGKAAFALDYHDIVIRSVKTELQLPSVLLLLGDRDKFKDGDVLPLSRKNILIRDEHTCQWCGKKLSNTDATIDHVFPLSRGGTNTWRNVVACCLKCNNTKDDRTAEEFTKATGKKLLKKPICPSRAALFRSYINKEGYETWKPYLEKLVN